MQFSFVLFRLILLLQFVLKSAFSVQFDDEDCYDAGLLLTKSHSALDTDSTIRSIEEKE